MLSPTTRRTVAVVTAVALLSVAVLVAAVSIRIAGSSSAVDPAADARDPADPTVSMTAAFLGDSLTVGNSDLAAGRIGDRSWFRGMVTGPDPVLDYVGGVAENGRLTSWMAERAESALASRPDLLVVLGGTNDVSAGVPPELIVLNLHRIADTAAGAGVRLAVATLPPLDPLGDPAEVAEVNDAIRAFAADRGAILMDVGGSVTGPDGRWLPGLSDDGIHPNAAGTEVMSKAGIAALRSDA